MIKAAALFADYDERLKYPPAYLTRLQAAAEVGEPGAAMALVRLKFSNHPDFGNDDAGARAILARLAATAIARRRCFSSRPSTATSASSTFNPAPRGDAMSEDEMREA